MRLLCCFVLLAAVLSCSAERVRRQDSSDFECPEDSGTFADPKSCRRFFQCVDKHPYVNRCPAGLFFDDVAKFCTFKDEARCGPIATTPAPEVLPEDEAQKCDTKQCVLPNCFCSSDGTQIPGGLDPESTPQMILISMDDSINQNNYNSYSKVFEGRKNPNGCPIPGTFFVSHEYTNYQMVQELHYKGHEIATYSVTHRKNLEDLPYEDWVKEIIGMREILGNFANVSKDDILGTRAPHLKPGRNAQFEVLSDYGFVWDSSASVPPLKTPVWPYTLDYKIAHECRSGTCPTRPFPGMWELPLNSHYVEEYEGGYCSYLDQCVLHNLDANDVNEWLQEDFNRHYLQNKAPYHMAFHTSWFQQKSLEKGLHLFLDWVSQKKDVWFVTTTQALLWITDPRTTQQLNNFAAWDCTQRVVPPAPCNLAQSCALAFKTETVNDLRYMTTCASCPRQYPWLGDAKGRGASEPDVYEPDNPSL